MRWPQPRKVTAQAAISAVGTPPGGTIGPGRELGSEVGFSRYMRSGKRYGIGMPFAIYESGYPVFVGSWAPVFFMDDITELEVGVRSWYGWVTGGATVRLWD
jgi:hypothetical protein